MVNKSKTLPRVVAAMSGGVDSSVAAALCVSAGYETIGVTLKLMPGGATGFGCCGAPEDVEDAKRVCEKIGIRHYVLNFDEVFEKTVIDRFVADYLGSRTPNPCVECNRSVKFGALLRLARAWNAEYVATGHYARIERTPEGDVRLRRAVDERKDQTYFLHSLTQEELTRILFPIGDLRKPQVRERARALGLGTAEKKESQEICFVPNRDYRGFLRSRIGGAQAFTPGVIRDQSGRERGRHNGLADFTIGQRRGLRISSSKPLYVTGMEPESNTLTVGEASETLRSRFRVEEVSWTGSVSAVGRPVSVRIRHRATIVPAECVEGPSGTVEVSLASSQRAITPGQAAVFYEGDRVLGGGTIAEVL